MCLGAAPKETPLAMSDELAAVLLCKQQAKQLIGLAAGAHGKILVTYTNESVVAHPTTKEASQHLLALGSSQTGLLVPVQQVNDSYVAAVLPRASTWGVLLSTPVKQLQRKPLLDSDQQVPLPSKIHSLHVLQPTLSSRTSQAGSSVAVVVLADGTVAAADFKHLRLAPLNSHSTPAASAPRMLASACDGRLLAVAWQDQLTVVVQLYAAGSAGHGVSTDEATLHEQQPEQPSLLLHNSFSIAAPSTSSKLIGMSISHNLLLVMWSCRTVSLCRSSSQPSRPAARQDVSISNAQLPADMAAVLTSTIAAAASTTGDNGSTEKSSKRKHRTAAAAAVAAAGCDWSACALSDQHLLFVALERAAGGTRVLYSLMDSTYNTCLRRGCFKVDTAPHPMHADEQLKVLPLPEHHMATVAVVVFGAVWLLPLPLPKADLAGLLTNLGLGSAPAHAAAAAAAGSSTSDSTQLLVTSRHQLNLSALASSVRRQQSEPCVLQPLTSTAASASFHAQIKAAVQQVHHVLSQQQCPTQDLQAAVTQLCTVLQDQQQQPGQTGAGDSHSRQRPSQQQQQQQGISCMLVSQQLLAQALSALAAAGQWSLLQQLHQLAPVQSLTACADLVTALAAAQQYHTLRHVLQAAQEVPADDIVKAVLHILTPQQQQPRSEQSLLSPPEAQQLAAQEVRAAAEAVVQQAEAAAAAEHRAAAQQLLAAARYAAMVVDGFTSKELLLHMLLAVQVDAVEAQAALRTLPAAAVLRLLRYLVKWSHKYSRNSCTACVVNPLLVAPSHAQALEWSKLLLDAQLTKLMLMPAAVPLLQQLQRLLKTEVTCTSRLVALKGVTDCWASGAPLPAAAVAANSRYVLELLDLRVNQ